MTLIYAVILFLFLIFPHELGHFLMGKHFNVKINEFSFGMGPALFKRQKGETLYAVRAIPIGGYCAFDAENEGCEDSRALPNQSPARKISIFAAGPLTNILITILTLSILMGVIGNPTTAIGDIQKGSPAMEAGLLKNDVITSVDGKSIDEWNDLTEAIGNSEGSITVEVERDGRAESFVMTPEKDKDGRYIIGIISGRSHNPFTALRNGAVGTWNLTVSMFQIIKQLITGEVSASNMAGPVGMIQIVSETKTYGILYFVYLVALMSLNLALMNLLPFPALDGGRILMVIIRMFAGDHITDDLEGKIHAAGMMILLALMVFVTFNDITRLIQ